MTRKLLSVLSLPLLAFAPLHSAQAQDLSHVPEEDISALVLFVMPTALKQVQTMCAPMLAEESYIYSHGDKLLARFETASGGTEGAAMQALMKIGSEEDPQMAAVLSQMPPEVLAPFVSELVGGMLAQEITPDSCEPINRIMELLDPMPAQNTADLVAYLVHFVSEQKQKEAAETDG